MSEQPAWTIAPPRMKAADFPDDDALSRVTRALLDQSRQQELALQRAYRDGYLDGMSDSRADKP